MNLFDLILDTQQPIDSEAIRSFLSASTIVELKNFRLLGAAGNRSNWCWAVVAQGVSRFFHPSTITQCQIAKIVFPKKKCCKTSTDCNIPTGLSVALNATRNFFGYLEGNIPFVEVTTEIRHKRPLGCRKTTNDGHYVVISATLKNGTTSKVRVVDPVRTVEDWSFQTFSSFWSDTYFTEA